MVVRIIRGLPLRPAKITMFEVINKSETVLISATLGCLTKC